MVRTRQLETRIATLAASAVTLIATTTGTVVADPGGGHMWDSGHMWGNNWVAGWMGLWGVLWMVLLVALPLALGYILVRRRGSGPETDAAMATLRERYARGEIDDEEFETLRTRLARRGDVEHG